MICAVAANSPAWAGFVTTNQVGMNAVYHQPSFRDTPFRDTPIDIRFNPTVTINNPAFLTINTEDELDQLFALAPADPSTTVGMFFVDAINECGGVVLQAAIGCGQQGGGGAVANRLAVESLAAAGPLGTALLSHELGHNLGLVHVPPENLMAPSLDGNTELTMEQVDTIFGRDVLPQNPSPLLQTDGDGHYFVLITPFAIVPEPATALFALAGAVVVLQLKRRRAAA